MVKHSAGRLRALVGIGALFAYVGCGGASGDPNPTQIEMPAVASLAAASSVSQRAVVAQAVAEAPAVLLKDQKGRPMAGITVPFRAIGGGGSIEGADAVTNASGVATVGRWTLGQRSGANRVTATIGTLPPVVFDAVGDAGLVSRLEVVAGDGQTAPTQTRLPISPRVRAQDAFGNATPSVTVVFSSQPGNGTLFDSVATTDTAGVATLGGWITGTNPSAVIQLQAAPAVAGGTQPVVAPVTFTAAVTGYRPVPANVTDQLTVYYQGWHDTPCAGHNLFWFSWARQQAVIPAPGNVNFDLYPDLREYAAADLCATALGGITSGSPTGLFSSSSQGVLDLHFSWMRQYGIDGAAIRSHVFLLKPAIRTYYEWRTEFTRNAMRPAEATGRSFYMEYELVVGRTDSTWVEDVKLHWETVMQQQLNVTASAAYARQGGKPVIGIWGTGFASVSATREQTTEIIRYFKQRGFYVIGTVPSGWARGSNAALPGWREILLQYDMLTTWVIGYSIDQVPNVFADQWQFEKRIADSAGIAYRVVLNPGSSDANARGHQRNSRPRLAGRYMWEQARYASQLRVPFYVATFDEFLESTAIAKAAETLGDVPSSQWFLTLDADGTRVSSDFYLRLTGAIGELQRGQRVWTPTVPVPPR